MKAIFFVLLLTLSQLSLQQGKAGYHSNHISPPKQTLQIQYVRLANGGSTLYGSLRGGALLYITGYGFDRSDPQNNLVFVGDYPCHVKEAGNTFLICQTTDSGLTDNSDYLPIDVIVGAQKATAYQTFRYLTSYTPFLQRVYPSAIFGQNQIVLWGILRISTISNSVTNLGSYLELKIGENLCSRKGYPARNVNSWDQRFYKCKIGVKQEAGKYDISHRVLLGYADKRDTMKNRQNFELTILPSVKQISPSHGAGQVITIDGTGFDDDPEKATVMIDGRICEIESIMNTQITCRLMNERDDSFMINTDIDWLSNLTQSKPYIAGSGWTHERYHYRYYDDIKDFRNIYYGGISSTMLKDTKILELRIGSQIQTRYYSEVMYGYFKAPVNGNYTFKGFASEKFALYVSEFYGTAYINDTAEPVIWSNTETGNTSYYNTEGDHIISDEIYMKEGEYYYMELYHTKTRNGWNHTYTDYLTLRAEVEAADDVETSEAVYAVHHFSTHFDPQPQIMEFTQEGAESGTLTLSLLRYDNNFDVTYNKSADIPYNCSLEDFMSTISNFSGYEEYPITGQLWVYDRFDTNITDTGDYSNGSRFVWRIFIYEMRTTQHLYEQFDVQFDVIGRQQFRQDRFQAHSDLISGTFQIQFAGDLLQFYDSDLGQQSNNFSFDASAQLIQSAFRTVSAETSEIRVQRRGDPEYSAEWFIYYEGFPEDAPLPIFETSELAGGKAGTSPYITVSQLEAYQKKFVYDAIGYDLLFEASDQPALLVLIDDLISVCDDQCFYEYRDKSPVVEAMALYGSQLRLTINVPVDTTENIVLGDLTITDANTGHQCSISMGSSTLQNPICNFPQNIDNSPILEGGTLTVDVWATGTGYLPILEGITPIQINVQLDSVNPSSGSANGGYEVQLVGNAFPIDNDYEENLQIKLCDEITQILDVTNTKIKIKAPACSVGASQAALTYKNMSASIAFTYNNPLPSEEQIIINSITPSSSSPVLKTYMQIVGSGFGNDSTILTVQLLSQDGGKNYPMKILDLNDTFLKVGLSGGLQGLYKVQVVKDGLANSQANPSNANLFTYEIAIENISPKVGSPNGGTLLTIRGRNFSPEDEENLVILGQQNLCELVSINETQIQCITPVKLSQEDEQQDVQIMQKLTESAKCEVPEGCSFTYANQYDGPILHSINKQIFTLYDQVTLTFSFPSNSQPVSPSPGNQTNQTQNSTNQTNESNVVSTMNSTINSSANNVDDYVVIFKNILTGKETIIEPPFFSNASNQLSFDFPQVQEGVYNIKLRNEYGDSNQLEATLMGSFAVSAYNITVHGGKVKIYGVGLPEKWPHEHFQATLSTDVDWEVVSISSGLMVIELFQATITSSYLTSTFKLEGPLSENSLSIYQYQACSTPLSLTYESYDPFNVSMVISQPTWSGEVAAVKIISQSNREIEYEIDDFVVDTGKIYASYPLLSGSFDVFLQYNTDFCGGFIETNETIVVFTENLTYSEAEIGLEGGLFLVQGLLGEGTKITVNGRLGSIAYQNENQTLFYLPGLNTKEVSVSPVEVVGINESGQNLIQYLERKNYLFEYISDIGEDGEKAFDTNINDRYSSSNSFCYAGIKLLSDNILISLKSIKMYLQKSRSMSPQSFNGIRFEGSLDGISWQIITEQNDVHSAAYYHIKNEDFNETMSQGYKYIRYVHNQTSSCSVDKIELKGELISITNMTTFDILIADGAIQANFTDAVTYKESKTPIINDITPETGNYFGGYNITLTGENLGFDEAYVEIDTVECLVHSSNATTIICEVQERSTDIEVIDLQVTVGGNVAVFNDWFYYVMRWSDPTTWGFDSSPSDGDLVTVPKGRVLYVDESTPDLLGIDVKGIVVFTDEKDMTIRTGFINVNNGKFWAGDSEKPYQHELIFEITGSSLQTNTQPIFGSKFIGCQECFFSMHGKDVGQTWTILNATASPGDMTIQVQDQLSWKVGDEIVIASTSYESSETETRIIAGISGRTITLDVALDYTHLSLTLEGQKNLDVKAEVGLLSQNIKITGVDSSEDQQFGAKMMIRGEQSETVTLIENVQFTKCGQPKTPDNACITSFVKGIAENIKIGKSCIHDTYGRGIYVENGHEIVFQENVLHGVSGVNIWLQGSLSIVQIRKNLVINGQYTQKMYQFDAMPPSIFTTGSRHIIQDNSLAGGDFSGLWYYLNDKIDGYSQCGWGMPIGVYSGNIIHSYQNYGVYIDKLSSRSSSCVSLHTDYRQNTHQAYETVISDFRIYRNKNRGLYIGHTGFLTITDCVFAENTYSVHIYEAGQTKENSRITQSTFFGQIDQIQSRTSYMIALPCSNSFHLDKIQFSSASLSTTAVRSCDSYSYIRTETDEYFVSNITYTNFAGKFVHMTSKYYDGRQIFYNEDGTFVVQNDSVAVVPALTHLQQEPECYEPSELTRWPDALICSSNVTVRKMKLAFTGSWYLTYYSQIIIGKVNNWTDYSAQTTEDFTNRNHHVVTSQEFPFIMNRTYTFAFGPSYRNYNKDNYDFETLKITPSNLIQEGEGAIIFRHNYWTNRQLYEVFTYEYGQLSDPQTNIQNGSGLELEDCSVGDFYHDNEEKLFGVCVSSKNLSQYEYISTEGTYCKYLCPEEEFDTGQGCSYIQEPILRKWSNETMWPNGTVPKEGDDVQIPGQWQVLLDVSPPPLGLLTIKGTLVVEESDITLEADNIWVKGKLKAGNSSSPFLNNFLIKINGQRYSKNITVDSQQEGSKLLVVTGSLLLYGNYPTTIWTRLVETAVKGSNYIKVDRNTDWKVGDQLVIAASFSDPSEIDYVEIASISDDIVYLTEPLNYTHFGDDFLTVYESFGEIDARAGVGHLSRNIKIVAGDDESWGYRILTYGYTECNNSKYGMFVLSGVQLVNGGQYNTASGAIHLKRLTQGLARQQILQSSIHHCQSKCLILDEVNNVKINNNVFSSATNFHIEFKGKHNYKILLSFNLMLDAHHNYQLGITDLPVACIEWKQRVYKTTTLSSSIYKNLCQGSEGAGFSFYFGKCGNQNNFIFDSNVAGTAQIGHLLHEGDGYCAIGNELVAYGCKVGVMGIANARKLYYKKLLIIDSSVGVALKIARKGRDLNAYVENSYISAIERPSCPNCYGDNATKCKNNEGIKMFVATEEYPNTTRAYSQTLSEAMGQVSFDSKAFITDVTFKNYNYKYSEAVLSECGEIFMFRPPKTASQLIGSHHLENVTCINCSSSSYVHFDNPLQSYIGQEKECGDIPCSGKLNFFIKDHDGALLGGKGSLIPNNQLGNYTQDCDFDEKMNGFVCLQQDFVVLEYESFAPDYDSRESWPISIQPIQNYEVFNNSNSTMRYNDSQWQIVINGNKEWTEERRLNRFATMLPTNSTYYMNFRSIPSRNMYFQLQQKDKESDSPNDWIIIKILYPFPNSLRLRVDGYVLDPIVLLDNHAEDQLLGLTKSCGANKFYYKEQTFDFVLNADSRCIVTVSLTNSIELNVVFDMSVSEFFQIDGKTRFTGLVCDLLQITDHSRVKIVGVYEGSVKVDSFVQDQLFLNYTDSSNVTGDQGELMTDLNTKLQELYDSGQLEESFGDAGFGQIIQLNNELHLLDPDPNTETNTETITDKQQTISEMNTLLIALIASAICLSIIIVGCFCRYRRKKKVQNENKDNVARMEDVENIEDIIGHVEHPTQQTII